MVLFKFLHGSSVLLFDMVEFVVDCGKFFFIKHAFLEVWGFLMISL